MTSDQRGINAGSSRHISAESSLARADGGPVGVASKAVALAPRVPTLSLDSIWSSDESRTQDAPAEIGRQHARFVESSAARPRMSTAPDVHRDPASSSTCSVGPARRSAGWRVTPGSAFPEVLWSVAARLISADQRRGTPAALDEEVGEGITSSTVTRLRGPAFHRLRGRREVELRTLCDPALRPAFRRWASASSGSGTCRRRRLRRRHAGIGGCGVITA